MAVESASAEPWRRTAVRSRDSTDSRRVHMVILQWTEIHQMEPWRASRQVDQRNEGLVELQRVEQETERQG